MPGSLHLHGLEELPEDMLHLYAKIELCRQRYELSLQSSSQEGIYVISG